MSDPEISRRCLACGATARQYALYCPQCGQPFPSHETTHTPAVLDKSSIQVESEPAQTIPKKVDGEQPAKQPSPALVERSRTSVRAAAEGLKGVEENVRERVHRIRKVSHIVIDQAAYDPSLRFLLVAGGFFLLFLILLILSKMIG